MRLECGGVLPPCGSIWCFIEMQLVSRHADLETSGHQTICSLTRLDEAAKWPLGRVGVGQICESRWSKETLPAERHFRNSSVNPPEINVATLVRAKGKDMPPGEAMYLAAHTGSNLSLDCRKPWKL